MSRSARLSFLAAAVLAAAPALAQQLPTSPIGAPPQLDPQTAPGSPSPVQWVIDLGGDFGSNKLVTVSFSNGDTKSLSANQGGFIAGGASFLPLSDGMLRTRVTLGVKYAAVTASNGSISFYAFPLEILETVDLRPFRLGAGLYALLAPKLSGSGFASGGDQSFDSSAGLSLRAEFIIPHTELGIGARYVWNKLSANGASMDAPAFGFVLSWGGASRVP
jgi:hypothetical protein